MTGSRTLHALELAAQFAEQRHQVLAENLANVDTPDYHAKVLSPEAFQASLQEALAAARERGIRRLELRGNAQFSTAADGRIRVRPGRSPAPNVLFHDGTNTSLERLAAQAAQNSLSYELATNLLRGKFETLLRAIKGRVT